jgi:hypothetical protein
MINKCQNCKYFVTQDTGFSNWTVEGSDVTCLKGKFKDLEDSYAWEEKQFFKQFDNCEHFVESNNCINFDVDGEITIEDYKEDQEIYNLLKENGFDNK